MKLYVFIILQLILCVLEVNNLYLFLNLSGKHLARNLNNGT